MSDTIAEVLEMSTAEWNMRSFSQVGGPGTLGSIWEKLKEMRLVVAIKRKLMTSSSTETETTGQGESSMETGSSLDVSLVRRQIGQFNLSFSSSSQSPKEIGPFGSYC